jgi:oligopeptide transport system permease protein
MADLTGDAWRELRRRPMFWIPITLITLYLVMAIAPGLFTAKDPTYGDLAHSLDRPSAQAWFGDDLQGADLYAQCIYGARASLIVGVLAAMGTALLGVAMGVTAGYRGGRLDALISRIGDVFFALPFLLGGIVILETFSRPGQTGEVRSIALVVITLVVLSWPVVMRLMRGAVMSVRGADYVLAARGLGASGSRLVLKHILPNAIAPVLVYTSVSVGSFIGAEASLSFLGVGLQPPAISWGTSINASAGQIRSDIFLLLFPSLFLVGAVLSFVLLGEAIREAIDPKLR